MESIPSSFKLTLLVVALMTATSFVGLVLLAFFGSGATSRPNRPPKPALKPKSHVADRSDCRWGTSDSLAERSLRRGAPARDRLSA